MRGKQPLRMATHHLHRNIPAYAGKTIMQFEQLKQTTEHPRVCGENMGHYGDPTTSTGTSPRMRGKLHRHLRPGDNSEEHPRVCGENKWKSG